MIVTTKQMVIRLICCFNGCFVLDAILVAFYQGSDYFMLEFVLL